MPAQPKTRCTEVKTKSLDAVAMARAEVLRHDARAKAEAETARKTAAEKMAETERSTRVREEERRELLKKLDRVPVAERERFREEERVVALGRNLAAKIRQKETPRPNLGALFGIDLEET